MMMNSKDITKLVLPDGMKCDFERGLVIVGANGAGKTRLSVWLEQSKDIGGRVKRISAQKSLSFPRGASSGSLEEARKALNPQYSMGGPSPAIRILNDYQALLNLLAADADHTAREYVAKAKKTKVRLEPPVSKLDKVKTIWESVFSHRELCCEDLEIKAKVKEGEGNRYLASEMSDGERVGFYLIAKILLIAESSIIIVDEPGLYLHKAVQNLLWNAIESERADCKFIYLTHDLKFASSRVGYKTVWVKSFDGDKNWEYSFVKNIKDVPDDLLLELYGSREDIILIEGTSSSSEAKLYERVFPGFFVKSCGSCTDVITYTKALNSNKSIHNKNVYGLIDRDRRTEEEIVSLEKKNIFTLNVLEYENLFVLEKILRLVAKNLNFKDSELEEKVSEAKNLVFGLFENSRDSEAGKRTLGVIKWKLSNLDIETVNSQDALNRVLSDNVSYGDIKFELAEDFSSVLTNKSYSELLKVYKNKGIATQVGHVFELKHDAMKKLILRMAADGNNIEEISGAIHDVLPKKFNEIINMKDVARHK